MMSVNDNCLWQEVLGAQTIQSIRRFFGDGGANSLFGARGKRQKTCIMNSWDGTWRELFFVPWWQVTI